MKIKTFRAATVGRLGLCSICWGEFSEKEMKVQEKYLPHPIENSWIRNKNSEEKKD